jgi:hypothetical protein
MLLVWSLKLMIGERFCGKFKKILLFFAGFRKTNLVLALPTNIAAYAEKGKTRVYSKGDQSS